MCCGDIFNDVHFSNPFFYFMYSYVLFNDTNILMTWTEKRCRCTRRSINATSSLTSTCPVKRNMNLRTPGIRNSGRWCTRASFSTLRGRIASSVHSMYRGCRGGMWSLLDIICWRVDREGNTWRWREWSIRFLNIILSRLFTLEYREVLLEF